MNKGIRIWKWSIACGVLAIALALATRSDSQEAMAQGSFRDAIFLHHSTGEALINQGSVREELAARGYRFWDHGYNSEGLRLPDGSYAGYNYAIPDDNTDPDGFYVIFSQPLLPDAGHPHPPPNAFTGLMRHDVIVFKSCFPASDIQDDGQLEQYKIYYRSIRARADQYPDHIFIAFTPPPLHPCATDAQTARRARAFANWLKSDEYLAGHPNLFCFDFFDLLAEPNPNAPDYSMLRAIYRPSGCDSHPNETANRIIGPIFAAFLDQAVHTYLGQMPTPTRTMTFVLRTPTPTVQPTRTPTRATTPTTTRQYTPTATATSAPTATATLLTGCPDKSLLIQRGVYGTVADVYIWQSSPDDNGNYETLYTGRYDEGYKYTLIHFDLSVLPDNAVLIEARFWIYCHGSEEPRIVRLHRITGAWVEDSVTWRNFGNAFDETVTWGSFDAFGEGWKSANITTLIQAWAGGNYPNYGFLLDDREAGVGEYETYSASETDEVELRPRLEICYTVIQRLHLPLILKDFRRP